MEQFKFIAGSVVVLSIVGLVGYWAVTTMQSGSEHRNTEKIQALESENEELKEEVEKLTEELALFQPKAEDNISEEIPTKEPIKEPSEKPSTTTTYKNQTLISELEELVSDNIYMKLKSKGSRVGTVQKFLNLYNKTSNRIDNYYGASTKTAVAAFQKAQGLTADGEAGPGTFKKMIEWLKKQG